MPRKYEREGRWMGYQYIKQWLEESLKKYPKYLNPTHEETMSALYDLLSRKYEAPVKMELLGVSRTYKLVFGDGRIEKITLGNETKIEMQKILHSAGLNVPRVIKQILYDRDGIHLLKIEEWIEGESKRMAIVEPEIVAAIEPKYWYKLGFLLSSIANHKWQIYPIAVCDLHWGNFVINYEKEDVWLIDCKKLIYNPLPEKWIYEFIIFNQYNSKEQIEAFAKGYIDAIRNFDEVRSKVIKHTHIFAERLYEKLEGIGRI